MVAPAPTVTAAAAAAVEAIGDGICRAYPMIVGILARNEWMRRGMTWRISGHQSR